MQVGKNKNGFTIVELLIVIVVIGILAAITIVSFNGVQNRAKFAQYQSSLSAINKALLLYNADTGSFPVTGTLANPGWRYSCATGVANFIPGLTAYQANIPQAPCSAGNTNNDTWLYGSDGVGYKLIHIRPADSIDSFVPQSMRDSRWSASNRAWGYWTPDWASN